MNPKNTATQQKRGKKPLIFIAVSIIVVCALVVVLGPWGPFRVSIYGSSSSKLTGGAGTTTISSVAKVINDKLDAGDLSNLKRGIVKKPAVALVIDDTGNTLEKLPLWLKIDAPLSFSVMPYTEVSGKLATAFHDAGYQVMMHIPTENRAPNTFSGKGQLTVTMNKQDVFATLDKDLETVPFVSGINNHQGGWGCDDLPLMSYECEWAKSRGFYVVDSASSNNSQVSNASVALGMGHRRNEVFIDHQNDPEYIRNAMNELAGLARKNGYAIGICHYHRPNTATTVGEMVRKLRRQGITFVYVKDITN